MLFIKQHKKGEKILNNISLNIEKGKIYGIVGHNGSGKSTFAKHISSNVVIRPPAEIS